MGILNIRTTRPSRYPFSLETIDLEMTVTTLHASFLFYTYDSRGNVGRFPLLLSSLPGEEGVGVAFDLHCIRDRRQLLRRSSWSVVPRTMHSEPFVGTVTTDG